MNTTEFQDLDFIEIGTSNFNTLIQQSSNKTKGISIEPIKYYLDQLPNKSNIKKINCAVAFDNIKKEVQIYYVPEPLIKIYNLPKWTVGCNSINDYHPLHKRLKIENLVTIETVIQYPISEILQSNNVRKIKHLKIDTEGGDSDILEHLFYYLKDKDINYYPDKITFETNYLTSTNKKESIIKKYVSKSYKVQKKSGKDNTVLIKGKNT